VPTISTEIHALVDFPPLLESVLLPKLEPIIVEPGFEEKPIINGKLSRNLFEISNDSISKKGPELSRENSINKEESRRIAVLNQNMRQMIYKEVKRPGKNHTKLFEMLSELHGPPSVRREYINDVIREARRFKRESLVYQIEQEMERLITHP